MESFPVRPAPHAHAPTTTRSMMCDVLTALLPALVWGTYVFGWRALILCLVSCASSVLFEALFQLILRRKVAVNDCSALVTGLLLAFSLPVSVPLWVPVAGAFFAVVIVKGAFGGLGKNFVNPALAARGVLRLVLPGIVLNYTAPFAALPLFANVRAEWVAAPQDLLRAGTLFDTYSWYDLLSGTYAGRIGEISALLLLAGGLYLIVKRTVAWQIPVTFLASLFALSFFFPAAGSTDAVWAACQILTGGTVLIAFFMATDAVTSPITGPGRILFGIGCGAITYLFRRTGLPVEGAVAAVLIMNLAAPLLDLVGRLPSIVRSRYR